MVSGGLEDPFWRQGVAPGRLSKLDSGSVNRVNYICDEADSISLDG